MRPANALGYRLDAARQRAFVGRADQTAAFRAALAGHRASAVLFVHGVGGTGKTALLRRFAVEAESSGRRVVRAERFDPATSAAALANALRTLGNPPCDAPGSRGPAPGEAQDGDAPGTVVPGAVAPPVLLIDDFDDWYPAEAWLREELLPALPLGTVVVLAGRTPPALEWTTDPGWQEMLCVHELTDLSPEEARLLLDSRSVPREHHGTLLAVTDGNPLALLVAIDTHLAGGSDHDVRLAVAHVVLERVIGSLPTPAHRRALETCAATEPTTEGELSVDADGTEMFRWLRTLPFVDPGPRGLRLRPFVREAVRAELRWRTPGTDHEPRPTRAAHAPHGPGTLARGDFESEVREALRSWRRPDLLAANRLTGSRLVAERPETDRVAALRAVLQAALDELGQDPREGKSHRALLATYLGGAPTQEAAAERLGLPFSTYRRHLAQGLAVLGSLLWWQETRGRQQG